MSIVKRLWTSSSQAIARRADEAFVDYMIKGKRPGQASKEPMPPARAREFIARIEAVAERLEREVSLTDVEAFYPEPPTPQVSARRARAPQTLGPHRYACHELSWPTGYELHHRELDEVHQRRVVNHTAVARAWLSDDGQARPTALLVHGYMGGHLGVEERLWPVEALLARGVQVVLVVLPHHGPRKAAQDKAPLYPSRDVRLTLEGMRQSIHELRALARWLRQAQGSTHVGVMGMSMGGYISSLWATLDAQLSFCVPVIPLACFADWADQMGTLVDVPELRAQHHEAIRRVSALISPLSRPRAITNHHIMIVGAQADHVTPLSHAERLKAHLEAPLRTFPGGHLMQLGRGPALHEAMELIVYACR